LVAASAVYDQRAKITGHWQITDRLGIYQLRQRATRS
jgi:hypothetical protein